MNRGVRATTTGFTIVELMLAMTFVSLLLMAIATTVIQMGKIYNRGTTLKAVDQTGRAISEDLQRTLGASRPLDIGTAEAAGSQYVVQVHPGGDPARPDGGRLCTGTYTYVWNMGYALARPINTYAVGADQIRLVKVRDVGGAYCGDVTQPIVQDDAAELLAAGDRELALQSFTIAEVATDPLLDQALYRIVMEVGTNDQDALMRTVALTTIDTACKPPSEEQSREEFCAVNKFEFTARAGNKGGE